MDLELKKMTQEVEQIVGKTNWDSNEPAKKQTFSFKGVDPKLLYPAIFGFVFLSLAILRPNFLYHIDDKDKKTFSITKLMVYSVIFFSIISVGYYFVLANSKFLNK